jgi:ceramide glucosyltransferase
MIEILSLVTVLGLAVQIFGILSMLIFYFFKKPPKLDIRKPLPGVSIIKSCYQAADNEKENFDAFFHQDYAGPIEILFTVSSELDPIVPLIQRYLKKYPEFDAKLVISRTRNAPWLKFDAIYDGYCHSKNEIIILSDSDVVVQKNYVSEMVACFQDPTVSLVTTPQYDIRANGFPSALKTLGNNADLGTFISILDIFITKKRMAWGHSIGFKKSEFDTFSSIAWKTMNESLADDLTLPNVFIDQGKKVVFRNIHCPVQYSDKTLKQVIDQKKKFTQCQKAVVGNRYVYLFGMVLYPQIFATVNCLASLFSTESLQLFMIVFLTRVTVSFLFEGLFVKSIKLPLKYFWAVMIWDLMQVYFVTSAFFKNNIQFNGNTYRISKDQKLVQIS